METCIISRAQHANPKLSGHTDPVRAQFAITSKDVLVRLDEKYAVLPMAIYLQDVFHHTSWSAFGG
jgi:hypothetical protein